MQCIMNSPQTGKNDVVLELIGKDARAAGYSDGYFVEVDGFLLHR